MNGMLYRDAIIRGLASHFRSRKYLRWVKRQICPCGCPADDPSHVNAFKGMGTKSSDLFVWPSCRNCHQLYEQHRQEWIEHFGDPWIWVAMTIAQAFEEGVFRETV